MNLPGATDRFAILGRTGSGKTQAGTWNLANRNYHEIPWIVYNFKRDELLDAIPHAHHIELNELPTSPGIYIVHPHPDDIDDLSAQFRAVWERGHIGLYIDEGFIVGRQNRWFRTILTQGRSLRIPTIVLSQRPVYLDKFVLTESEYLQVFQLQHEDDIKSIRKVIRADMQTLPDYHSYYFDVRRNELGRMAPVPDADTILGVFERRLRGRTRTL